MIKYAKYMLLLVSLLFVDFIQVHAINDTCSTSMKKTLSKEAAFIKANYEIKDFSTEKEITVEGNTTTYKIPNYAFEISLYNLKDYFEVTVSTTNKSNTALFTINGADATDGVYTFMDYDFGNIYNYIFTVRTIGEECNSQILRTIKFTKPKYNAFSEYTYCKNSSNYYCQRFVGTDLNLRDSDDFLSKIKVNNDKNNPNREQMDEDKEIKDILKNNWKIYLIVFIVVLGVLVGSVVLIRRYNKKKGWRL